MFVGHFRQGHTRYTPYAPFEIHCDILRRTYYWSRKSKDVVWVLPPLEVEKKKEMRRVDVNLILCGPMRLFVGLMAAGGAERRAS